MEDHDEIRIAKGTQQFIREVANWNPEEYNRVKKFLETLGDQQSSESQLEKNRGWRYMWQRTPKVYLLMLAYFVFFGSAAAAGFWAYSRITDYKFIYLSVFVAIMLFPLIIVFYLSYNYVRYIKKIEEEEKVYDEKETRV